MLLFGRASPADCADEDVHNPSVDGLGTYQIRFYMQSLENSLRRILSRLSTSNFLRLSNAQASLALRSA